MPVVKLKAPNSPAVMKNDEGNDSLDTVIKQAIGKEPYLSFSRLGDNPPVQWIQLLHALDQQELPGWPLLSPLKVQMQKCDKCSREFCSPINYRRHIRVHHRLKKLDKDSLKNRNLLALYWDKLSLEEMREIMSFNNISLEGVPGIEILKNLTAVIRKPGFSALPHVYLRAGSALLDLVQGRPSRFPITSQELFGILDDASEKTFLCGTAVSMQKYVFNGEAAKVGVETKNLVACTSFLIEQKLVKAWVADKDAEALRCHKLLVEEEEADQRRQVELLERKRQKKLRQKEQKTKDQMPEEKADGEESMEESFEAMLPLESSTLSAQYHSVTHIPSAQQDHFPVESFEIFPHPNTEEEDDSESQSGMDSGNTEQGTSQNVEQRIVQRSGHRHTVGRWQVSSKSRGPFNGFHLDQNSHVTNGGAMPKHGSHRQFRAVPVINGNKVWSRKPKQESDGDKLNAQIQKEAMNDAADQIKRLEVLIGSISVTLGNSNEQSSNLDGGIDDFLEENQVPKKINFQEKSNPKSDYVQRGNNRAIVKLWRPVSRNGKGPIPVQNGNGETEVNEISEKSNERPVPNENSQRPCYINGDIFPNNPASLQEGMVQPSGPDFSIHAAKAFLAQRWKEATMADHVKLVLSANSEPTRRYHNKHNHGYKSNGIGDTRTVSARMGELESSTAGAAKFKIGPEKRAKIEYISEQRNTGQ